MHYIVNLFWYILSIFLYEASKVPGENMLFLGEISFNKSLNLFAIGSYIFISFSLKYSKKTCYTFYLLIYPP